jgi:hypothetical protein
MNHRVLLSLAVALLVGCPAAFCGGLKVESDKDNVVGSRLEGKWARDPVLTERLTGEMPNRGNRMSFEFKSDTTVAEKIPEKFNKFLADKKIYLAGMMTTADGKQYPFLLIELKGNPHVVYFRERDGDPMGDAESFNVMLAVAHEKKNDLLFIGGDFNNQPFTAYSRAKD